MNNFKVTNLWDIAKWPLGVLLLHTLATVTGGYWYWGRLDNVMHFLGGVSIGLSAFENYKIFSKAKLIEIRSRLVLIFLVVSVTALAANLWEFMEYIIEWKWGVKMQTDLTDTMSDIALGMTGGLIAALLKKKPTL